MDSALVKKYHELAIREKPEFISYIYNLGEKYLKQLFSFPGKGVSLWWFSLIAEKPPLKSRAYEKLIAFLMLPEPEKHSADVAGTDRKIVLWNFLKGLIYLCYYFVRIIKVKSHMLDFGKRKKQLYSKNYLIVSYFPLIDKAKAEKDIFENKYFAGFHRILLKQHKDKYAHVCVQSNMDGYDLTDSINLANRFKKKESLFMLEEFFKLRHFIFIIFYYFYFSVIFLLNKKRIRRQTKYQFESKSYDIWHLLKDDFYNSFCGENLASSLYYIFIFKQLTTSLGKNTKIVCTCEMQWWERALYIYAKKEGITTIGFQHSIIPELLLNYFNVPQEIANGPDNGKCPLPDYIAAIGNITSGLLIKYGWPRERVFVWGAQRFERIKDIDNLVAPQKDKLDYLVCAFSIDQIETQNSLLLLRDAFKERVNYKILLKGHYACLRLEEMIRRLDLNLNYSVFEIVDEPMEEALMYAKGIIVTESSSCLYALAYGIPIIVPRFMNKLDCNPLSYISNIPIYVYSAHELREVCDKVIGGSPKQMVDTYTWMPFLKEYLYFPKNDTEYFEKIESLAYK